MQLLNTVAALIAAVGTVSVVFSALWLQVWRVSHKRPVLSIEFPNDDLNEQDWSAFSFGRLTEVWLRMKVSNERGRDQAEQALVFLLGAWSTDRMSAAPVASRSFKWSDTPDTRVDIPAGSWRRVDIAFLDCPRASLGRRKPRPKLYLALFPWIDMLSKFPRDAPHLNELNELPWPGKYVLTIALSAKNCDSVFYDIYLEWENEWERSPMRLREHIRVTDLRKFPRAEDTAFVRRLESAPSEVRGTPRLKF